MIENDDFVKEFLVESNENLDQLDRDLIELEKNPASREILSRIFRTVHTIKGTTGFLGFSKLGSVAHAGESLLSRLRDGDFSLTPQIANYLLAMVDSVREMLAAIEATGQDGGQDYTRLVGALQGFQGAPQARTPSVCQEEAPKPGQEEEAGLETPSGPLLLGQILSQSGHVSDAEIEAALQAQRTGDPRHLGEILVERGAISPAAVREAIKKQKQQQAVYYAANTIRVDVYQLDKLMDLAGELVLARNEIMRLAAAQQDACLLGASQRLSRITHELHEGVTRARMQPIDSLWSKLLRLVRDLAQSCGKRVRVEMEGRETRLDRAIIEALKDSLVHAVRNAVDHGIETPEQRIRAGKPAEGLLTLRAFQESGQVRIEISDDGAGINLARVKQKAIDRGLVTSGQAASMPKREAMNLIFLPGFSTAAEITNVSGRGVGLDVVRTDVEKIGGAVEIESEAGRGSALKITVPLTLALLPASSSSDAASVSPYVRPATQARKAEGRR
jgi:two-component system, chemotaxis family, sensor kinase CheA